MTALKSNNLYQLSVPVFLRYLNQLDELLSDMQLFAKQQGLSEAQLLAAKLADDMFPLGQQMSTAIGFSLRTCLPLAGRDIENLSPEVISCQSLQQQLHSSVRCLQQLKAEQFEQSTPSNISTQAGFAKLSLSPSEYLQQYMLPNFFFHYTMSYAILRQHGMPLSKQNFDGYHQYPAGFSF
ncbi:DUF1993 family protein [Agarivorans aestuarii]|uniref:DUF1993 family protein n=1 Tax=Agarivorans aestuarii TaxID=1563703 RepID=UPI001C827BB7|nr:DUF1993 domain-containing protein [Agarivorans aestuarii]